MVFASPEISPRLIFLWRTEVSQRNEKNDSRCRSIVLREKPIEEKTEREKEMARTKRTWRADF